MNTEIASIGFPNTVSFEDKRWFRTDDNCTIERFEKNGEMARVGWFRVTESKKVIAEIKESVCDIYFK